jgi:hypothetical protein
MRLQLIWMNQYQLKKNRFYNTTRESLLLLCYVRTFYLIYVFNDTMIKFVNTFCITFYNIFR